MSRQEITVQERVDIHLETADFLMDQSELVHKAMLDATDGDNFEDYTKYRKQYLALSKRIDWEMNH